MKITFFGPRKDPQNPFDKIQFQRGPSLTHFLAKYGTEEQCREAPFRFRWPKELSRQMEPKIDPARQDEDTTGEYRDFDFDPALPATAGEQGDGCKKYLVLLFIFS